MQATTIKTAVLERITQVRMARTMRSALLIFLLLVTASAVTSAFPGQSARAQVYDGYWANDNCYYAYNGGWYKDGCYLGLQDLGDLGVHHLYGKDTGTWVYVWSFDLRRALFAWETATGNSWYSDGTQWIYLPPASSNNSGGHGQSGGNADDTIMEARQIYHDLSIALQSIANAPACTSSYNGC